MIQFDHVSKQYGEHHALHDVSFIIPHGSFVSVIGPSGVGKTTIAKLIIGAETPSAGTVHVNDILLQQLDAHARALHRQGIGMIFQDFKLLSYKTVWENVSFVLEVCGATDETIQARTKEVLDIVHMTHAADKFPRELSGGEQQRVAIARAIVHKPRIIIADEPTGNLDHRNTADVITLLRTVHALPTTVLLMTHDRDVVDALGSRIIELKDHRVVRDEAVGTYHGH